MDVKYTENGKYAEFNGNKYTRDERTGYYLNAKGTGTRSRLHRDVWEHYNGKIPKDYHVHHIDHNKSNNEIDNLELLEKSEHERRHSQELTEEQKERRRNNIIENVIPAASIWHGSEAGKEWHSQQAKKSWENRKPIKYICSFCGKEFESLNSYGEDQNKFCSNNCKCAYRKKMGYDNIEKTCEFCGKTFIGNKYIKHKYCSVSCGKKAYWKNKREQQ